MGLPHPDRKMVRITDILVHEIELLLCAVVPLSVCYQIEVPTYCHIYRMFVGY